MIRCHTRRAILSIMIRFTKPMDLLARDEDPRRGRRHIQSREALLLGRICGGGMMAPRDFDAEHQADFCMEGHADGEGGRTAVSEVCGGKGGGVEEGMNSGVPFVVVGIVVGFGFLWFSGLS